MTFLLDVNVLIALVDQAHIGHEVAHRWFERRGDAAWATCPITELGLIRIIGNPKYPNSVGSPAAAAEILARLRTAPGHVFWSDDFSVTDARRIDAGQVTVHGAVTDAYLLALAASRDGKLATLDRRIATNPVPGGKAALLIIGAR